MSITTLNTSTQFEFRLAVVDLLRSDPRFSELQVSLFPIDFNKRVTPGAYIDLYETRMSGDWGQMGHRSQVEQYVMDGRIVLVQAGGSSEDQQAIIERADELAAALQHVIRDNYKMDMLSVPIRDCALISMETMPIVRPEDLVVLVPFQIRVIGTLDYV